MDTVELGKRIKNRRLELNLTQSDVKQKTGISTGNLSDIERGRSAPSASALCELSDVLECSVDYILFGKTRNTDKAKLSDIREQLTPVQELVLSSLLELDPIDQEEILDIIEMKIRRKKRLARSLNSELAATSETA
jgi:transcriptional regulator with XRE-family HTH domain